jgi:signal transduction histidine kinase
VNRFEPAEPVLAAGLGAEAASAVLAAVEECLSNVARHAGVDVAEVVINRQADDLVALVVDRGRGFDPDQVPEDRLGLAESVRGRILDLGGSVTLWSRPGAGTTVMLTVPVGVP